MLKVQKKLKIVLKLNQASVVIQDFTILSVTSEQLLASLPFRTHFGGKGENILGNIDSGGLQMQTLIYLLFIDHLLQEWVV